MSIKKRDNDYCDWLRMGGTGEILAIRIFCHRTQTALGTHALFYTNLGPFTRSKIVGR